MTKSESRQQCEDCQSTISELDPASVCPACGGLLELIHPSLASLAAGDLRRRFSERRLAMSGPGASGVWRYRELVLPSATDETIVSHPEGNTPLLGRSRISEWAGVDRLLVKH